MGLKIVDDGYGKTPELRKDAFWDDEWVPLYSEESAWEKKYTQHEGSLSHIRLDKSVSQVRMVPLQANGLDGNPSLRRRFSSVVEKIVSVKPEETENRSTFGSFIKSASKLSLHSEGRKLSRRLSSNFFENRSQSAKEPSVRMSACDSDEVVSAPDIGSFPKLFAASSSGSILNPFSNGHPHAGELSRVTTDESSDAMHMFAIGERDFRTAMDALDCGSTVDIELARPEDYADAEKRSDNNDDGEKPVRRPSLMFSFSA